MQCLKPPLLHSGVRRGYAARTQRSRQGRASRPLFAVEFTDLVYGPGTPTRRSRQVLTTSTCRLYVCSPQSMSPSRSCRPGSHESPALTCQWIAATSGTSVTARSARCGHRHGPHCASAPLPSQRNVFEVGAGEVVCCADRSRRERGKVSTGSAHWPAGGSLALHRTREGHGQSVGGLW
jgi:hypothetical protein